MFFFSSITEVQPNLYLILVFSFLCCVVLSVIFLPRNRSTTGMILETGLGLAGLLEYAWIFKVVQGQGLKIFNGEVMGISI